jgi:hypothetical protein
MVVPWLHVVFEVRGGETLAPSLDRACAQLSAPAS